MMLLFLKFLNFSYMLKTQQKFWIFQLFVIKKNKSFVFVKFIIKVSADPLSYFKKL